MLPLYLFFSSIKSLQFYLQKHIGTKLNVYEYLLMNSIVFFAVSLSILFYNLYHKKENYKNIQKLDTTHFIVLLFISLFSVASIFAFFTLGEYHTIPIFLTISKVMSALLIVAIGYFIFGEKLTFNQIIGIMFCIIGILFLYRK
jgi:drug/metabolite transporter (DMT)-like permease